MREDDEDEDRATLETLSKLSTAIVGQASRGTRAGGLRVGGLDMSRHACVDSRAVHGRAAGSDERRRSRASEGRRVVEGDAAQVVPSEYSCSWGRAWRRGASVSRA